MIIYLLLTILLMNSISYTMEQNDQVSYLMQTAKDAKEISGIIDSSNCDTDDEFYKRLEKQGPFEERHTKNIKTPFGEVYVAAFGALKLKRVTDVLIFPIPFLGENCVFYDEDLINVSIDQDHEKVTHFTSSLSKQKICALRKMVNPDQTKLLAVHVIDLKSKECELISIGELPLEQININRNDKSKIKQLAQDRYFMDRVDNEQLVLTKKFNHIAIGDEYEEKNVLAIATNSQIYIAKKDRTWCKFTLLKELTYIIKAIEFNKQKDKLRVLVAGSFGKGFLILIDIK